MHKFQYIAGQRYTILRESKDYEAWREEAKDRVSADKLSELDEKFEKMRDAKTLDRKKWSKITLT